jgi:PAS domain S-box-containing protein
MKHASENTAPAGTAVSDQDDPAAIVQTLALVQQSLLASYARLAERADRVDRELVLSNIELQRKVQELDAILQALPTGVVVRDEHDRIVRANDAACRILGTTSAELVGESAHPGLLGPEARGECREYARGGERRAIASRWSPIESDRRACGSVEILDDRTEIERLQSRLNAQCKMAALGNMAAGIAHEIRNPLNAIGGFADLLRRELVTDARTQRFAARILAGVEEVDQIVTSMLSFGSPQPLVPETVDPHELLESATTAARRVVPENAPGRKWQVISSVSAPAFVADRIKVRQALRNLIANALQAQPGGGTVDASIALDGGDVVFRVQDAGPGVPDGMHARISEPFFTTRAEGTGLGLALVHSIAELHGGRLEVSPCPASLGGADIAFRIPFQP